jgi:hypothetical protein
MNDEEDRSTLLAANVILTAESKSLTTRKRLEMLSELLINEGYVDRKLKGE